MKKVLCIGAHNDEIMADMGGTANLLKKQGCEMLFLNLACQWHNDNFTDAEKAEYMRQEHASAEILGGKFMTLGNRDDMIFVETKDAIEETARLIMDYNPDIVFIHWPNDNHIEHRETAQVSYKALCIAHVRGTRFDEVYAFDTGINQSMDYFRPDFYVNVSSEFETVKESLMQYNQNHAKGPELAANTEKKNRYRGAEAGCEIAESFKIIKFPNQGNDFLLRQLMGDKFIWHGNGQYPAFGECFF